MDDELKVFDELVFDQLDEAANLIEAAIQDLLRGMNLADERGNIFAANVREDAANRLKGDLSRLKVAVEYMPKALKKSR